MNISPNYLTQCALRNSNEIIVPTFNTKTQESCTAIFNINYLKWTKLEQDKRSNPIGGNILV